MTAKPHPYGAETPKCAWKYQMKGYTIGCELPAGHPVDSDGGPHQSLCNGPFYVKASAPAPPPERCAKCGEPREYEGHFPPFDGPFDHSFAAPAADLATAMEALRNVAEHLVKMRYGAHNCAMCGVLYHEIREALARIEEKK